MTGRRGTVRLTTAGAIVHWLVAQRTLVDGTDVPLFPGVFAIFGHGNVTCLGHALAEAGDALPTWRGQNEQGMALAAIAYAKAMRRRQVMVATSSIGPGALNMVTAAGVAMANRLPILILAGDTFTSRIPDPVLQQIEHPGAPTTTANDAFRAVVRYWDRITSPPQLVQSLPQALRVLTDPAECGPAFLALPQDTQGEAWDFPEDLFRVQLHEIARPRPDDRELQRAAELLRAAKRPLIVAGGGVHYSLAEEAVDWFARKHCVPVVETVAGKSCLTPDHPSWAGPIGVTGWSTANALAREADVVLAIGTRLGDFTTGSWSVFSRDASIVCLNASRFDAAKHRSQPVVGDIRAGLAGIDEIAYNWTALGIARADDLRAHGRTLVAKATAPSGGLPSYAQVVGAVNRFATEDDYIVAAAGGLPGELNANWLAKGIGTVDCEYGFSCMGYEISGGWGAAMARRDMGSPGKVIVLVGDGSYLMANSDLYSSVLSGHPMIVVVCDNGGYAVIDRLQRAQGGEPFNNMIATSRVVDPARVDFAAHAASLGCSGVRVSTIAKLEDALAKARNAQRTTVVVVRTDPDAWSEGGAFWQVGVPEVSDRPEVVEARKAMDEARSAQWIQG